MTDILSMQCIGVLA